MWWTVAQRLRGWATDKEGYIHGSMRSSTRGAFKPRQAWKAKALQHMMGAVLSTSRKCRASRTTFLTTQYTNTRQQLMCTQLTSPALLCALPKLLA